MIRLFTKLARRGMVAWGAGSNANAFTHMQVELAHVDSKARFKESYKRYIWLIRYYADKYGIPKTLDAGGAVLPVLSHTNGYLTTSGATTKTHTAIWLSGVSASHNCSMILLKVLVKPRVSPPVVPTR